MSEDPSFQIVLHWLPEDGRWEWVSEDEWQALNWRWFTAVDKAARDFAPSVDLPQRPATRGIAGIPEGVRHFIRCLVADDELVRLDAMRCKIGPGGQLIEDDSLSALSPQEREEVIRLRIKMDATPQEQARYNELCMREVVADLPPRSSLPALRRMLQRWPMKPDTVADSFWSLPFPP